MKTISFKVTLLSDVILNQKSATVGQNQTLDFIPGSNFLGIASSSLYDETADRTYEIFHSGKVRFGDAHPLIDGNRTMRVPLAFYHPKFVDASEVCYVHHHITDFQALADEQLKQCRNGFYDFTKTEAKKVKVLSEYTQKSAHNKDMRRSEDHKMFGYEAIKKGLEYAFSVEMDDEKIAADLVRSLTGIKRLGRSRSAQYGLIEIEPMEYKEPLSNHAQGQIQAVYLDSRLIVLDEFGLPTFQPSPTDLGIDDPEAEILWDKSQVRTFCYSPWNSTRQCYDTDRCGLEKGSVIIIKSKSAPNHSCYKGVYKNEGFGRLIYNPAFLNASGENGKSSYHLIVSKNEVEINKQELTGTKLLSVIARRKKEEERNSNIYSMVNNWVRDNQKLFNQAQFAAQWGNIRTLATQESDCNKLKTNILDYLRHGVASKKWDKFSRINVLENFMNQLTDENAQLAIINLSAEMGKICEKGGKLNG